MSELSAASGSGSVNVLQWMSRMQQQVRERADKSSPVATEAALGEDVLNVKVEKP